MKSSCAAHASKQLLREQGSVPPNLAHHRPAGWIQPLGPSKNIPMTFLGSCPCGAAEVMGWHSLLSLPALCQQNLRGLPSDKQLVKEKGTYCTDKIIRHLRWSSQRPVSLKSSPVTLYVIPSGWICCTTGRKLASQKRCLKTETSNRKWSLWKHVYTALYLEKAKIGGAREPRGAAETISTAHHGAQRGDAQIIIDPGCKVQAKETERCVPGAARPGSCTPTALLSSRLQRWLSRREDQESHPVLLRWCRAPKARLGLAVPAKQT